MKTLKEDKVISLTRSASIVGERGSKPPKRPGVATQCSRSPVQGWEEEIILHAPGGGLVPVSTTLQQRRPPLFLRGGAERSNEGLRSCGVGGYLASSASCAPCQRTSPTLQCRTCRRRQRKRRPVKTASKSQASISKTFTTSTDGGLSLLSFFASDDDRDRHQRIGCIQIRGSR